MSTKTYNCKFKNNRQLRLGMEATIDELAEIETKICAKLMKNPDCVQEASQPFIDTNPDYVNPLRLKDNSSRIRVFEHIEKAELLAENDSGYVMQPFPLYDNISWTLESQIPIKNYEFTSNIDLDSHLSEPIKSNGSTFLSSLLPIVTSNDEAWLDLVPPSQKEIDRELTTFKEPSSSCSLTISNIGAGIWNTQLQTIAEEYCGDNKSVDVSHVTTPNANENDVIFGMKNPEVNIGLNNSASNLCALDFGVISGEVNKNFEIIPENQSKDDCTMDVFSKNYASKTKNNGFYWPVQVTTENYDIGNAVGEKTNLKFQYAAVIGDNLERKIPNSEDCIILVCKECGFQEYI